MKKILITGASGFIGSNLIARIIKDECEVAVINRISENYKIPICEYIGDITDFNFMFKTINDFNPTNVFHLAAYKKRSSSVEDIRSSLNINLIGTLNLYQSLLKLKTLNSVITLGTIDEYGDCISPYSENIKEKPLSAYGFSKFCVTKLSEFFFNNFNLPITVLRPTIAYGPKQGMDMFIPSLINSLLNNKTYEMTPGNQIRDFIYVSDLIDAILNINYDKNSLGNIFNVGSGFSIKIKDVALIIAKSLGKEKFLKIGAINYRKEEVMDYNISIDKILNNSNWKPKTNFEEGLELTIKYFKSNA